MRIVRGVAERLVDPRLELLGKRVLEPVGLVVDVGDVEAERLREVQLEQAVMADHLERDAFACRRQLDAAIGLVPRELERRELLDHRARGGVRDVEPPRERGHRHLALFLVELVDLAEVVLDRFAERLAHAASVGSFPRTC